MYDTSIEQGFSSDCGIGFHFGARLKILQEVVNCWIAKRFSRNTHNHNNCQGLVTKQQLGGMAHGKVDGLGDQNLVSGGMEAKSGNVG